MTITEIKSQIDRINERIKSDELILANMPNPVYGAGSNTEKICRSIRAMKDQVFDLEQAKDLIFHGMPFPEHLRKASYQCECGIHWKTQDERNSCCDDQ